MHLEGRPPVLVVQLQAHKTIEYFTTRTIQTELRRLG